MDARMQKHRMTCWLGRVFVALSLVVSYEVQAMVESVAPIPPIIWWADAWPANEVSYASVAEACSAYHLSRTNILTVKYNQPGTFSYVSCIGSSHIGTSGTNVGLIFSYMNCPAPSSYTYRPYWLNWESGMCERTLPDTFTITLSGGNEVEPSKASAINTLPIIATVIDRSTNQPPTNQVNVRINLKVATTSGGHNHGDNTRPRGGIATVNTCPSDGTCWSNPTINGAVAFNFNAPEAAGIHTITATCDGCANTVTKQVDVKVTGLEPMAGSILYAKIMPNADTNHPNTNYLTTEAMARLADMGLQYSVTGLIDFGMVLPPLQINDASLKWGGILDCFLTCINSEPWGPSHEEHRKGTVVDIRANGGTGSIPTSAKMTENFIALTRKAILSKYPESTVTIAAAHGKGTGRHFHVRLLGRKE